MAGEARPSDGGQSDRPLAPPGQTGRALMIVNPQAGLGLWPGAQPAAERLLAAGWRVDVVRTDHAGHATELARRAVAEGYHVAIERAAEWPIGGRRLSEQQAVLDELRRGLLSRNGCLNSGV